MNTFSVFIKEGGTWKETKGKPVFPFSRGELLDERLDEAYITLVNDPREIYSPLTEIKVSVGSDSKYYVVARDDAVKNPLTKLYKHSLYLLERTKLLEGVICPSLTFTNSGGIESKWRFADDGKEVDGGFSMTSGLDIRGISLSYPPVKQLMSPRAFAEMIATRLMDKKGSWLHKYSYQYAQATVEYEEEGVKKNQVFYGDESINIPLESINKVKYDIELEEFLRLKVYYASTAIEYNIKSFETKIPLFKRLSISDCVHRVLDLAEPIFFTQKTKYKFDTVQSEKYKDIIAPEFSMTECTLREQLKIIGSYIHAEPRLNENDEIYFDEYGCSEVSPIGNTAPIYDGSTWDVNEYCTEVKSNAKNLTSSLAYASVTSIDPSSSLYRSLRSEQQYVRVTTDNGIIKTDFPIYAVKKILCGILNENHVGFWLTPVDITGFVYESTFYGSNLSSYGTDGADSKSLALFYTQGSNNIGGLFYRPPNASTDVYSSFSIARILSASSHERSFEDIKETIEGTTDNPSGSIGRLVFQVSYIPIHAVTVSHGKGYDNLTTPRFSKVYNQSEQLVESSYYGENIKGVAARLGNVEKERTFILKSLSDLPKVGQMLDGYAISAVSSEINTDYIKCTVGLTKDFNRISEYIGVSSVRRMYEISERNVSDRNVFIHNTILLGDKIENISAADRNIYRSTDERIAIPFMGYPKVEDDTEIERYTKPISFAVAQCFPKQNPGDNNATEDNAHNLVILPVIPTSLGNSMIFSFSYADNYSAGSAVRFLNAGKVMGYWQDDVPYTDLNGRAYWLKFGFSNGASGLEGNITTPLRLPRAYDENSSGEPVKNQISNNNFSSLCTLGGLQYPLLLRKDNREKISLTYELEFKSNRSDLVIGSALASGNPLVKDVSVSGMGEARIVYFTSPPNKFSDHVQVSTDNEFISMKCISFNTESVNGVDVLTMYEDHWLDGKDIIEKVQSGNEIIDVVVGQYSFGAPRDIKGFAIVTSPNSVTSTVVDDDGVESEQTIEYGGEVLLMRIADIKEGEPLFGKDESGNPRKIYFNVLPN